MRIRLIRLLVVSLLLVSTAVAGEGGYLFVTFKNGNDALAEQIYFGISQDGRNWKALNGGAPMLVSDVGEKGVRDPYILRSHDGSKFFLIATDLSIFYDGSWSRAVQAGSKSVVVWESLDLVHWSEPRLVAVASPDAGCTWAPEAVYDEENGDYLVHWASTSASDGFSKHRIWACRTTDFVTFGEPFIYIEKPVSVIDATIVREGGNYYRFTKDETYKAIAMETSGHLMGPWTTITDFSLASIQGYEGPECYQLSSGEWCLIADHYSVGAGYKPFVTNDLASGAFTAAADFVFPFAFRHGSVLSVTAEELSRLRRGSLHLPFNEAAGAITAADVGDHGWHATPVNGSSFVAGKGGNAVSLDGSDAHVSLPTGVVSLLEDFTVSTWVKPNSVDAWSRIFDFGTGTGANMFLTPRSGDNAVRFAITTGGNSNEERINGASALPVNEWSHVAVTLQGGVGILYVNGEEAGRNSAMTLTPSSLGFTSKNWIGRSQYPDPYFNGLVDDFRIYDSALPASEIQSLYAGAAGTTPEPWADADLGAPALVGASASVGDAIALSGAGVGLQGSTDRVHYTSRSWTGDGTLAARLDFLSANASSSAHAGVMFREDLSDSGPCVYLGTDRSGNLTWQYRDSAGGTLSTIAIEADSSVKWLRVTRSGDVFAAWYSSDGVNWTQLGAPVMLALPETVNAGLAMSSGSDAALEVARFGRAVMIATPTGLSATANGSAIDLTWNGVSGASGYHIKRAVSSSGPFVTISANHPAAAFSDEPTADGTIYYYVVSAVIDDLESLDSSPASSSLYSDYQKWKIASGYDVDADLSTMGAGGMPLLVEFALGTEPGAMVKMPSPLSDSVALGISFTRPSPAPVRYIVQVSADLAIWEDVATLAYGEDVWTGSATVVEDISVSPRKVTVVEDSEVNPTANRFYRLLVQRPVP